MGVAKTSKNAVIALLTAGIMTAVGVLSVSGATLIHPGLGFALAAFIFGGVAEGEGYFKGIKGGIDDLGLLGHRGVRRLVARELGFHLQAAQVIPPDSLCSQYQALKNYLDETATIKLNEKQKKQRQFALERLARFEAYITKRVMDHDASRDASRDSNIETDYDLRVIQALRQQRRKIKIKMGVFRALIPVTLLCGGAFSFVIASQLPVVFAMATFAGMGMLFWPLAVVAGMAFTLLIIHLTKKILMSQWVGAWKERINHWLHPADGKLTALHVLKVMTTSLALVAVVALCVAGTIATGGAMWLMMKDGAAMLTTLTTTVNRLCNSATILLNAAMFTFSVFSSIKSVDKIATWFSNASPVKSIKETWQALRASENWAQILDPFRATARLAQVLANIVMYLGHIVANGMGADQSKLMSPIAATLINAGNEAAQDATFFMQSEGKKTITSHVVDLLVAPLLLLSMGWQTVFSRFNNPDTKPKLSFRDAFIGLGLHEIYPYKWLGVTNQQSKAVAMPVVSSGWRTKEINECFDKEERRLSRVFIGHKQAKVTALLKAKNYTLGKHTDLPDISALNRHRLSFCSSKQTKSAAFLEKMQERYGAAAAR